MHKQVCLVLYRLNVCTVWCSILCHECWCYATEINVDGVISGVIGVNGPFGVMDATVDNGTFTVIIGINVNTGGNGAVIGVNALEAISVIDFFIFINRLIGVITVQVVESYLCVIGVSGAIGVEFITEIINCLFGVTGVAGVIGVTSQMCWQSYWFHWCLH